MIFSPYDNASCGDESIGFLALAISLFPIILPSATIQPFNVGYQEVEVPTGYYIFTPTFKNVSSDSKFDIKTIKPILPSGVAVGQNQKVTIFVLDESGNYGVAIYWYGKSNMWTKDGIKSINDGEVMVGNGQGVAVWNTVKVNASTGVEVTKGGVTSSIKMLVSGEVDLVCKNTVPTGYMINGNSTPNAINLKKITPRLLNGTALRQNQKVTVFMLDEDGNYGAAIYWYGKTGIWTTDGATEISDLDGTLNAGQGFAIWNTVKINASTGAEVTKGGVTTSIYLELPSPITVAE